MNSWIIFAITVGGGDMGVAMRAHSRHSFFLTFVAVLATNSVRACKEKYIALLPHSIIDIEQPPHGMAPCLCSIYKLPYLADSEHVSLVADALLLKNHDGSQRMPV